MQQLESCILVNGNKAKKMVKDILNYQISNIIMEHSIKVSRKDME